MSEQVAPKTYLWIWLWLAVLLGAAALISQMPIAKAVAVAVVLLLSTIKAALVVMYYMHLKFDRRWLAWVAAFPLVIVALAVMLVLSSRLVRL